MKKYKLIGLSGQKRSGKDTIAQMLRKELQACKVLHFADALKSEVSMACNVDLEEIEENKELFRPMLQWWGTEFRRKYQENDLYWIEQVKNNIDIYKQVLVDYTFIVADVRFENEAEFIKENGGLLVRVIRPELLSTDMHSSEVAMNNYTKFDYLLYNNGTLKDLELGVRRLLIEKELS